MREYKRRVWEGKGGGIGAAALAIALVVSGMGWGFLFLIPACILFFGEVAGAAAIRQQRSSAEEIWKRSIENWNRSAGSEKFDEKKGELLRAAASYRALPGVEQAMLRALDGKKREFQLQKHLEAHKIARARIDGIGDGRKMTLRSFGIETAWDVKHDLVTAVPGFGPVLTDSLMRWRRSVEGRFVFNPNAATDPADIARVRNDIALRRSAIEAGFIKGIRELEILRAEALARRSDARQHEATYLVFRQAEADSALL